MIKGLPGKSVCYRRSSSVAGVQRVSFSYVKDGAGSRLPGRLERSEGKDESVAELVRRRPRSTTTLSDSVVCGEGSRSASALNDQYLTHRRAYQLGCAKATLVNHLRQQTRVSPEQRTLITRHARYSFLFARGWLAYTWSYPSYLKKLWDEGHAEDAIGTMLRPRDDEGVSVKLASDREMDGLRCIMLSKG